MVFSELNLVAVLVAAVAYFALGALWYSPALFGKLWMRAIGKTHDELQGSWMHYAAAGLASVVAAFVLAYVIALGGLLELTVATAAAGAMMGILVWVGFVGTTMGTSYLFGGRGRVLFLIDASYHLVGFFVMGGIIGGWPA